MAESTNPLDTLKIKKLIGFKQITPGVITSDVISALRQCGVDAVTSVNYSSSEFSIGSMSFLGNTFYGLKVTTDKGGKYVGALSFTLAEKVSNLENTAIQVGFRLTATANNMRTSAELFNFHVGQGLSARAAITNEDTSAYYEATISTEKDSNGSKRTVSRAYVNKQLIATSFTNYYQDNPVLLQVLTNSLTTAQDVGFSYMIGDMYIAELDYNSDGTVTPQLLGNLTLEPFTVATYSGDKHINTLGNDIVTAINTLDPNNDMGVLEIKPVMQAASFTFNPPDITNGSIMGASINIVYKDSAAPNNRLRYRITEGTQSLPTEVITDRKADITGYSTFTRIMTTPEGGGAWNTDNTRFALKLFNSETPEEE
ncbi:hypothetical protein CCO48_00365 [Salmonella enterica subsp. enterica serovar Altendorf]|uniref:hypothetical protein n=1 Tax=Salmonella enterica TaxID=28901 RepID=UPI000BA10F86|nr:hypothetical protein [Salmonella enterica]OZU14099.1 hypothetical protein CCO48_00365 [Salmonella enterica subsp. enterica serovar Altendorf]